MAYARKLTPNAQGSSFVFVGCIVTNGLPILFGKHQSSSVSDTSSLVAGWTKKIVCTRSHEADWDTHIQLALKIRSESDIVAGEGPVVRQPLRETRRI